MIEDVKTLQSVLGIAFFVLGQGWLLIITHRFQGKPSLIWVSKDLAALVTIGVVSIWMIEQKAVSVLPLALYLLAAAYLFYNAFKAPHKYRDDAASVEPPPSHSKPTKSQIGSSDDEDGKTNSLP